MAKINWRPIETHPKDDIPFLGKGEIPGPFTLKLNVAVCIWNDGHYFVEADPYGHYLYLKLTHWAPIE